MDVHFRRRSERRPVELVAICEDRRGVEGLCLAATVSVAADMRRKTFPHDGTPESLALALDAIAAWIRVGAPSHESPLSSTNVCFLQRSPA